MAEARRVARVADRDGLHARPCARIAEIARRSRSEVFLEYGWASADAKSILELLILSVSGGAEVTIRASGPDADSTCDRIVAVLSTPARG